MARRRLRPPLGAMGALDQLPQAVRSRAVVISGGTTGIGRATAILLASRGARVLVFGRHRRELDEALRQIRQVGEGYGVVADQARVGDVRKVFAAADRYLGGVDVLVNNAGIDAGSILQGTWEDWEYGLHANLLGYLACCRYAIDRMRKRGGGHIVNIGSMSAETREEGSDLYVATKAAIQAFSASLRKQVNTEGIRVTLIEPGAVATDIQKIPPRQKRRMQQNMQMLPPEDVAECVHWCLTQPARVDVVLVQVRPAKQLI